MNEDQYRSLMKGQFKKNRQLLESAALEFAVPIRSLAVSKKTIGVNSGFSDREIRGFLDR